MKIKKHIIYILLFVVNVCFAQNSVTKKPLTEIITAVEQKFDVKFSYAFDDVSNVFLEQPNPEFNLQQTIAYLNSKTLLNFKILDDRYITVSVIEKTISICGFVYALENKDPLFGASVVVNDTKKGIITSETGRFQLHDVSLNAVISISYLGYKSQQFIAKQFFSETAHCNQIVLIENKEVLNQVLITKFLTTGFQKLMDGSTVLNTKNFGILPGLTEPDILQSIQILPGVESTNESIANINVRGGTNDQNLMLWDGIKMYHSGHFFGLISAYNPNLTNKVVVTKNGTSSEFSNGVSSTINMFTKNELSGKFAGAAGMNLISADAFFEIPISKKLELHISGRRSITDAFNTPTYDNYFNRSFQDSDIKTNSENIENQSTTSDFVFYDYTAKVLFDLNEHHKFRANVIGINNNLDYQESITQNDETESKSSNLAQKNLGFGGHWMADWNSKLSSHFTAYYSKYTVDANDYRIETDQLLTQTNEVLETGFKFNTYYKLNDFLTLLNGYQFNESGILNETAVTKPEYDRTKKDVLLNHAFYTQAEYNKDKTFFRIGVRANYFQKFQKLIVEPRLNIRQKLSNQFAAKLEGEFKNQSATQIVDFQDDFLGVENRRWILANEQTIPISTSKQASFGIAYNQNNLNIDVTGFYKIVEGITASNQGFYNNFQYINAIGDYSVKGLEFLANKTSHKYSTWVSYTYSINDYKFETFTPSVFPNNVDIRHSISVGFNYDILENLKISVGGMWRSGQPYTSPVEGNETVQSGNVTYVNYGAPNSKNLDEFKRLDASLSYKFNVYQSINASLKVGVLNLMNTKNIINRYYEVNPNDSESTIQINNTSLSLTPNMSFRVDF
ncbi:carboxypeptidase-like regulatory domain-containing protein [Mariniflexile gromovii]|uniref:Carboxypeptidase-like regulatory domain-containing protein n=1 Tax=Mariniflexile gromovii TaxID=362523 RepID=A0ABS4BV10_9FLAO|nr:carboxypeptidase-like regulatory domain-containing protein [Mariniflexile gromovii]MBP0904402.1 carboxypeptidase-like regulatory domain-containing protein [Mariniflexile gromovii]